MIREEKTYFRNFKTRDVTDNKTFWRKVKPVFSEKLNFQTKITLAEKGNGLSESEIFSEVEKMISYDRGIADAFLGTRPFCEHSSQS